MTKGRYSSRQLTRVVSAAHRADRSRRSAAAFDQRDQSRRAGDSRRPRRRAESQRRARAAPRDPDRRQGQHRHGGPDDDDRRIAGARGLDCTARCVCGRTSACRRCRHHRQDQPQRVGQLPIDEIQQRLERSRRAGEKSLTPSTAIRADRAREREQLLRRTSRPLALAPRPTARSCVHRRCRGSSASSRRWGASADRASFRFHTRKTPRGRWPGRSQMRRHCWKAWPGAIRTTAPHTARARPNH